MATNITLKLDRDLLFFDTETTGLNVVKDRILQLAMIKYPKNGSSPQEWSKLINPGIPISEESMSIHGITPAMLANQPTFRQLAQEIFDFIGDADLAGYNSNRFDVPLLMEEFDRVGLFFDVAQRRLIDAQRIFYRMEPRTLRAAYRYYCQEELTDAHDALADVRATVQVFFGQLERYNGQDLIDEDGQRIANPIVPDVKVLHKFINDPTIADTTQRLRYDDKRTLLFNFGKYLNQPVEVVFKREPNYYHWMIERDFSVQTKRLIQQVWQSMQK
jgi:DNA polymerase-3 subunit epsilon